MIKNILRLPDGREISSGDGTVWAIKNLSCTKEVNSAQDLILGAVCTNMLTAELITYQDSLSAGQELAWYREDGSSRVLMGMFTLEKPERVSANILRITGFDRAIRLDKDLSCWLEDLNAWPYTVQALAQMVCDACGVELTGGQLPCGNFPVQKFTGEGITGRMLLGWLGGIAGRFCRIRPDGKLEFAWYAEKNITVGPGEDYPVYYYRNTLKYQDYATAPIEKVQIRQGSRDVGTVYPDTVGNTYVIEANPMLTALDAGTLQVVAQTLYETLHTVSYTPCTLSVPAEAGIEAGDILTVADKTGDTFTAYVMKTTLSGSRISLESRGSRRRDDTRAVNNRSFRALTGKVLNLRTDVDGIRAENMDMQGNLAAVELSLSGMQAQVQQIRRDGEDTQTAMTQLQLLAEGLQLSVEALETRGGAEQVTTGTGFTFDSRGLQVQKSGSQMKTQITEDGMKVYQNEEEVLSADSDGVNAKNLHATTFLTVGGRSRFENYGADRTGCFWIGG